MRKSFIIFLILIINSCSSHQLKIGLFICHKQLKLDSFISLDVFKNTMMSRKVGLLVSKSKVLQRTNRLYSVGCNDIKLDYLKVMMIRKKIVNIPLYL